MMVLLVMLLLVMVLAVYVEEWGCRAGPVFSLQATSKNPYRHTSGSWYLFDFKRFKIPAFAGMTGF